MTESITFPGEVCADCDRPATERVVVRGASYGFCHYHAEEEKRGTQETSLGQILVDGEWIDYARGTLPQAIQWASAEPEGEARVVDWIKKGHVLWPLPSILTALPED